MDYFTPNATWLHGGPASLDDGALKRYGKKGADAGALFFVKNTVEMAKYAALYAKPAIWEAAIGGNADDFFDITNPDHVDRVRGIETECGTGDDMLQMAENAGCEGGMDWACVDDEVLMAAGFKGAILLERPPGVNSHLPIHSLAVFDASIVQTLGRVPDEIVKDLKQLVFARDESPSPLSPDEMVRLERVLNSMQNEIQQKRNRSPEV